ncbi:MAG: glycosyltransferase family 39 protein [Acidimicrobiia bacterium]|nr:glycosyltransferase family 39 protein [Acidimicrobiia bacterium]
MFTPSPAPTRPRVQPADASSLGWELWLITAATVALGVALRFYAPTSLWLDEALSVNIADLPPGDLLEALRRDGHPPLYYLVLHYWMSAVGAGDVAVRALSGVVSLAALPLMAVLGHRYAGRVGAVVALGLSASAPFMVRYATETRMYALVMLEVIVAWLLVDDLLRGRRPTWRVPALAVVTGAGLLTHYWVFFLAGATGVTLLAAARWGTGPLPRRALLAAAGLAGGLVVFAPWVPTFLEQMSATGTPWAPPLRPTSVAGLTLLDLGGGDLREGVLGAGLLSVVLLLGVFGRPGPDGVGVLVRLRTASAVRWPAFVGASALGIGSLVAVASGSTFATRYAAIVVPIVVVVATVGVCVVPSRVSRAVLYGAVCLLVLVGAAAEFRGERTQAAALAAVVDDHALPGSLVVYCPDQLGPGGHRVMPAGIRQVVYPTLGDPRFVDWVDYEERNASTDPAAVAEQVLELADGSDIYLVWNPHYRTFEGQCEELRDVLAAARPGTTTLEEVGSTYFEAAALTHVPAQP